MWPTNGRAFHVFVLQGLAKVGKKVPGLNNENVRELSLYSYRIIYQIKGQSVFVLAVLHKRRNLKMENI